MMSLKWKKNTMAFDEEAPAFKKFLVTMVELGSYQVTSLRKLFNMTNFDRKR